MNLYSSYDSIMTNSMMRSRENRIGVKYDRSGGSSMRVRISTEFRCRETLTRGLRAYRGAGAGERLDSSV